MKKAGSLLPLLGAVLCFTVTCLSGCGFQEGAGATVTVVRETPTPTPTPTPEATPTPEPTPTPMVETETTASGVVVQKIGGTYVTNTDVNLRTDASTDNGIAPIVYGVPAGTSLTGTGVCENGWIQISYEGQTVYASGEFLTSQGGPQPGEAVPTEQAVTVVDEGAVPEGGQDTAVYEEQEVVGYDIVQE